MLYDLNKMDNLTFECISQSLFMKMCGPTCKVFGIGRDGKREATFELGTPVEICGKTVTGRTFMQSKHKNVLTKQEDIAWLRTQLKNEMDGLAKIKIKEPNFLPINYFLFTNVRLTSVKDTGGKDKIEQYVKQFIGIVPNIYVVSYDEICSMIDNNSDVRNAYFSFLTSGDIISKIYKGIIDSQEEEQKLLHRAILRFMDYEFNDDLYSRLKEAGDVTGKQIPLECVFMELEASYVNTDGKESVGIIKHMISTANRPLNEKTPLDEESREERRFVLLGDAGQGKSTLGQYLAQIYRAMLLKADKSSAAPKGVESFLAAYMVDFEYDITCMRIPFRIILKDYAAWIRGNGGTNATCGVLDYLAHRVFVRTNVPIQAAKLYEFLESRSWVFIFDGLDEVPSSSNRADVMKQIYSFTETDLRRQNIDALIVATSRQQDYHKDFPELQYNHYRLIEMNDDICLKYVTKLINQIEPNHDEREKYIAILEEGLKDPTVSKLMRRPLHASIVAILVRNGGRPPREKYALFHEYVSVNIKRERQKNIFDAFIKYEDTVIRIHEQAAFQLQQSSSRAENAAAVLRAQELEAIITNKILELGQEENATKIVEELLGVVSRLAFLSGSDEAPYLFTIRSVQEYFAAEYLIIDKESDDIEPQIEKLAPSAYWRNVLVFAVSRFVKNRRKLADYVNLVCGKLNGSELALLEQDVYKGSYMGARLALDLLHENIFSENISVENQYLNHLDKILNLHYMGSAIGKIANLPMGTLQKFINNYLHPHMKQYYNSKTAWEILWGILNKHEEVAVDAAKDILNNYDVDMNIMLSVSQKDNVDEWLLPFVIKWLANGRVINHGILINLKVSDSDGVSISNEKRNAFKASLLKSGLLFFRTRYEFDTDWFFTEFHIDIVDIVFRGVRNSLRFGSLGVYEPNVILESEQIEKLKHFNAVCKELDLSIFEKWSSYMLNTSQQSLIELMHTFYKEDEYVQLNLTSYFHCYAPLSVIWNDCLAMKLSGDDTIKYVNDTFDKQRKLLCKTYKKIAINLNEFRDLKNSDLWRYFDYAASVMPDNFKQFIHEFDVIARNIPDYNINFINAFLFVILCSLKKYENDARKFLVEDSNYMDIIKASFVYVQNQSGLPVASWKLIQQQDFSVHFLLLLPHGELPNSDFREFESSDVEKIMHMYRFANPDVCNRLHKKINKYINLIGAEHNALKIIPTLLTQATVDKSDICVKILKEFSCDNPYSEFGRLLLCLTGDVAGISGELIKLCEPLDVEFIASVTAEVVIKNNVYTDTAMKVITDLYVKVKSSPTINASSETSLSKLEQAMFEMSSNVIATT